MGIGKGGVRAKFGRNAMRGERQKVMEEMGREYEEDGMLINPWGAPLGKGAVSGLSTSAEFDSLRMMLVMREMRERLETDPFWDFIPYPKQMKFFKSKAKTNLFIGGNKAGKTELGAWKSAGRYRNEFKYNPDLGRPTIGWIVGLDFPNMLTPVIIPAFLRYLGLEDRDFAFDRKNNMILNKLNGNKVFFKSCDSGAGKFQAANVDWIWFDEEPPADIWSECKPRLIAADGDADFTFTPTNGISWSYDELYRNPEVFVIEASMYDNPYLKAEVITQYEKTLTVEEREMRVSGKYVVLGGNRQFPSDIMTNIRPKEKEPIFAGEIYNGQLIADDQKAFKLWMKPDPRQHYFIGVDTSEGTGSDYTAIQVACYHQGRIHQAAEFKKIIEIDFIHRYLTDIAKMFYNPLVVIERNSSGEAVISRIRQSYKGQLYMQEYDEGYGTDITMKLGWRTTEPSKVKMLAEFKEALRGKSIDIYSKNLMDEMDNYIQDKRGKYRAQSGHDDLLMAFMLAMQGFFSKQFVVRQDYLSQSATAGRTRREMSDRERWHNV